MKSLLCLLGHHEYPISDAGMKLVDGRPGHLIYRVSMCCVKCGKPFEDIITIPFPEWLQRTNKRKEE